MAGFRKTRQTSNSPVRQLALAVLVGWVVYMVTRERHPEGHVHMHGHARQHLDSLQRLQPIQLDVVRDDVVRADMVQADVVHADLQGQLPSNASTCLPYIFYDKPVKTGSTAVTDALDQYLGSIAEGWSACGGMQNCTVTCEAICSRRQPQQHLIQHVLLNSSTAGCLRGMGYYHVTSIREPKSRVISAWKYSLTTKSNHYGIPYNASFDEFARRYPRCALYTYYDQETGYCTLEEAVRRAEEIASRFDEVIDLTDDVIGDVHGRIAEYLKKANVSPDHKERSSDVDVPDEVVELEFVLYNKLRERRRELAFSPRRMLCLRR